MPKVCTRPDIAYEDHVLGRSQQNPEEDHRRFAKKVMRYLKQTKGSMLVYSNCYELEIIGYEDSDFAGSPDEMKLTCMYVFKLAFWSNV